MSDFHVFVSYNVRTQQASADAIAGALRMERCKVFVCSTSLVVGADWRSSINNALMTSVVFFALLNDAYSNSSECITELNYAVGLSNSQKTNKETKVLKIVPVMFKGFNPKSNANIASVVFNWHGVTHDGTLLTNGSPETLRTLLQLARSSLNTSVGDEMKAGRCMLYTCFCYTD